MKKILISLVCLFMLVGCASAPVIPGDNSSSLDRLKIAVSALDTVVNVIGPIVIINLCAYDANNCAVAKADLKTAQDAMVLVHASLDAAVAANGANGTEAKAIAALSEAAKHVGDINQVSVDITGRTLITMPPEVTAVVPVK
jgi:hypothetical protein